MPEVRARWLVLALAAIAAGTWWTTRDTPEQARAKEQRAERAAAAIAEDARPVLYRWRNADGVVQITDAPPPAGVKYARIDREPRAGAAIDGARD